MAKHEVLIPEDIQKRATLNDWLMARKFLRVGSMIMKERWEPVVYRRCIGARRPIECSNSRYPRIQSIYGPIKALLL
jgi:hypothetical protein